MKDSRYIFYSPTTQRLSRYSQGGGRSMAIVMIGVVLLAGIFIKIFFLNSTAKNIGAVKKNDIYEVMVNLGLSSEDMRRIPDNFYREDVPADIVKKLPPGVIETVPSRITAVKK